MACEEEVLAGHLHAEASPGRASDAAKQAASRVLDRLKCPVFSPLDLHNGFPNAVKVITLHPHTGTCQRMTPMQASYVRRVVALL